MIPAPNMTSANSLSLCLPSLLYFSLDYLIDQTWASVWKGLSTTRWEVSAGKTDASNLAFKC